MQKHHFRNLLLYTIASLLLAALLLPSAGAELNDTDAVTNAVSEVADNPSQAITGLDIENHGKNIYREGDFFDPSDYTLRVFYADGTSKVISYPEFTAAPYKRLVTDGNSEDVTVEFKYGDKVKKEYVTVKRPTDISIVSHPVKTTYNEGEKFDSSGLEIQLTYPDGTKRTPEKSEYKIIAPSSLTVAESTVTIECYGKQAEVSNIKVIKMTSLVIIRKPDKCEYFEGEKFDPTGMIVVAEFDNDSGIGRLLYEGEYEIVGGELDCLVPSSEDRNFLTLTVLAGEVSDKIDLIVHGFESFVITPPYKTDYYYGESFNPSGLEIKGRFTDNKLIDITDRVTIDTPDYMAPGSEVKIKYLNYSESLISVHEIRSIKILSAPSRTTFVEGETVTSGDALKDMLVVGVYDDGKELPLSETEYTVLNTAPLTLADSFITVMYQGLSASTPIIVTPSNAVSSIEITTPPTVVKYISNQPIDISGLVVTINYEDGTQEIADNSRLKFYPEPGSGAKVTNTRIKITYSISENLEYTASQPIEVLPKKVVSLAILTPPDKTVYVEGEAFDPTGMSVIAIYNDNTSAQITSYTFSPTDAFTMPDNLTERTESITISYVGCSAIQNVTVVSRGIKKLEVAQNPNKLNYKPGEMFDASGLILKVIYNDGSETLLEHNVTPLKYFPIGVLTVDIKEVLIVYRDQSLLIPITVNADADSTDTDNPTTTQNNVDTVAPPETSGEVTTYPQTADITSSPDVTTHPSTPGTTPQGSDQNDGINTVLLIWIAIIVLVLICLVVLIIYYKRNFT